jgi:uncharacterized protein (TIGR03000 family)
MPPPTAPDPQAPQLEKLPPPDPKAARIRFYAPSPEAVVWIDDFRTSLQGSLRHFDSPALEEGKAYTYRLTVVWEEQGQLYRDFREVEVSPGSLIEVDYRKTSQ